MKGEKTASIVSVTAASSPQLVFSCGMPPFSTDDRTGLWCPPEGKMGLYLNERTPHGQQPNAMMKINTSKSQLLTCSGGTWQKKGLMLEDSQACYVNP